MSDDKVTIDPEFRPPRHNGPVSGRSRWFALGATAAMIVALGWMLPAPEGAAPPSDDPNVIAAAARTVPPPGPLSGDSGSSIAGAGERGGGALEEAVPGFTDTITAVIWGSQGVDVLRWLGSESAPATVLSVDHAAGGRSESVDASGRWYMEIRRNAVLAIYVLNDANPRSPEPRLIGGEVGAIRTWSAAWHDSRPGRLAWLACSDAAGSPVELRTTDLAADTAGPAPLPLRDFSCDEKRLWLVRWGDWGVLLHAAEGSGLVQILLSVDGAPLARGRPDPAGEWFVGVGPEGSTVWTAGPSLPQATSFIRWSDQNTRMPVPGLAGGQRLERAQASPDGSLLALVSSVAVGSGSLVRILEASTGEMVAEIEESSSWVNRMVWSSDGRFLVYDRWPDVASNRAGVPQHVELVFHDTAIGAAVALPMPGFISALRSAG